jgi:hypothetical protein
MLSDVNIDYRSRDGAAYNANARVIGHRFSPNQITETFATKAHDDAAAPVVVISASIQNLTSQRTEWTLLHRRHYPPPHGRREADRERVWGADEDPLAPYAGSCELSAACRRPFAPTGAALRTFGADLRSDGEARRDRRKDALRQVRSAVRGLKSYMSGGRRGAVTLNH